jgi:hypothetical protein
VSVSSSFVDGNFGGQTFTYIGARQGLPAPHVNVKNYKTRTTKASAHRRQQKKKQFSCDAFRLVTRRSHRTVWRPSRFFEETK